MDTLRALVSPPGMRKMRKKPKTGKTFGVALDTIMEEQKENYPTLKIPLFVHKAVEYLKETGMLINNR